jgi:hypothetical protein
MEAFATTTIIVLVGMAIPIFFLLAAVVFDLAVGVYVLFRFWRDRWWPRMHHAKDANGDLRARGGRRAAHPMLIHGA